MDAAGALRTRVAAVSREAATIVALELHALDGGRLPPFTAGAHIDVRLPNGLSRSYSLCNPQGETHRYRIAVHLDPGTRGGSRYIHETVRAGDELEITPPRNNFALVEDAPHSVLVAGGIGVTPLLSMAERLQALGRSWRLHYCARSRTHAAFLAELASLGGDVAYHFDDESGGGLLDLAEVIAAAPPGAHFYCCGPTPMMKAFEAACAHLSAACVHTEYFSGTADKAAGGFEVVLAKSGLTVAVPEGRTILDVLLDAGIDVAHSCTEGVCGSCETAVLEGIPDHRDALLSEDEKRAGRTMMICCSGAKTPQLVLDL